MMKIESKRVSIPASAEKVFKYASDLDNFQNLLPADKISDWEGSENYCSFKVKGTATIDLIVEDKKPPHYLLLKSGEKSPFPFSVHIHLETKGEDKCEAFQVVEANLNPFMKMMAEKPLQALFDFIADRLLEVHSA